jgi:hypothetical protein
MTNEEACVRMRPIKHPSAGGNYANGLLNDILARLHITPQG